MIKNQKFLLLVQGHPKECESLSFEGELQNKHREIEWVIPGGGQETS